MEVTFVVIDDNPKIEEHPLLFSLEDKYVNVEFFLTPSDGLDYIKSNLHKNLIVLLDIEFSQNDRESGHTMIKEIYNLSALIPVILWSGINEEREEFSDFINNKAFGFLSKTSTLEEAMEMIDRAYVELENSLGNIIEDWIIANEEDKDKPIYVSTEGNSYSLNDILKEVRGQTELGQEFATKLNALTIDLLLRRKENL